MSWILVWLQHRSKSDLSLKLKASLPLRDERKIENPALEASPLSVMIRVWTARAKEKIKLYFILVK